MRILRPTTSTGPSAAAVWKDGRPTKCSRPGSPESEPATLSQERGEESSVGPDLGKAGCQVITVLVQARIKPFRASCLPT